MIRILSKWLARVAWLIWVLAMLLVGLKIALDNSQSAQITLFDWQTPALSLGLIVCVSLLCGVLLGWFANIGPYLAARRRANRLEKQLGTLRTAPLK